MSVYGVVLFLHVLFVLVAFGAASIVHITLFELRRATTVAEVRLAARRLAKLEIVFPLSALLLFLAGGYLVHDRWTWGTSWVSAAIAGLLVMEALGGTLLRSATARLHREANEAADGSIPDSLSGLIFSRATWVGNHVATGLGIGIVLLMTSKPGTAGAIAVLVIATVLAAASALPFSGVTQTVTA